jgi:hypothetical protein
MQSEINIRLGKVSPAEYMQAVMAQCEGGLVRYGGITDMVTLKDNLAADCIPETVATMTINEYDDFLETRRRLVARKLRTWSGRPPGTGKDQNLHSPRQSCLGVLSQPR